MVELIKVNLFVTWLLLAAVIHMPNTLLANHLILCFSKDLSGQTNKEVKHFNLRESCCDTECHLLIVWLST